MNIKDKVVELWNKLFIQRSNESLIQLIRYVFVGGLAFLVDFGSFSFFNEVIKIDYKISNVLAFILGLTTNYLLSIIWVFTSQVHSRFKEFIGFAIIGIIGLAWNEFIIIFTHEVLDLSEYIGKIIATIFVFFWNFFVRKYLVFTKHNKNIKDGALQ